MSIIEPPQYHENQENSRNDSLCQGRYILEARKQFRLAGPLIAVSLLQYSLQVIAVMFVGHLGELALSSASLASSFASVTGYSVLIGLGSALETLCGQAYGAEIHHLLGIYTQRAMLILSILSIPISVVWFLTERILLLVGQNREISAGAGTFNRWLIPSLFAFAFLQCLNRFLQTQNNVFPLMITSTLTVILHLLCCWGLILKSALGIKGAALAICVSNWVNVVLLTLYILLSPACSKTWTGFSSKALKDTFSFSKLAVSSAAMICLEYWSFEMVVLLSGLLPDPKLETSVLSITLNTCWMVYTISVGLGGAISTRVANELGGGRAGAAKAALCVMIVIALSEGLTVGFITIMVRHVWGNLYSNDTRVTNYVSKMMPLLALSDFLDGFQCVLSGSARGCGWQKMCVWINIGAYYLVGIPCAVVFAFTLRIGGKGLWMGIICALVVQTVALVGLNVFTDWEKEAIKAMKRVQKVEDFEE